MTNYSITQNCLPEKIIQYQGENKIWLGGTNYLGIGFHPLFQEKLKKGIELFPQNWGSSRRNNLQLDIWGKFEDQLSVAFPGKSVALCSSGMAAAQTALYFIQKNHPQLSPNLAPFTHPALWMPQAEVTKRTYKDWVENISQTNNQLYGSDGIGAPIVQEFELDWTKKTSPNSFIVIDESHRFGLKNIHLESPSTLIQTASLSKAYGIPAGMIIGPKDWIEELKKDPFWVGTSPPNPAFIYASLNAHEAYEEQVALLNERIQYFQNLLPISSTSAIQRVENYSGFSCKEPELFQHLLKDGFLVNQFAYPNPNAPAICKGIIHPLLSMEEIELLANSFNKFQASL